MVRPLRAIPAFPVYRNPYAVFHQKLHCHLPIKRHGIRIQKAKGTDVLPQLLLTNRQFQLAKIVFDHILRGAVWMFYQLLQDLIAQLSGVKAAKLIKIRNQHLDPVF